MTLLGAVFPAGVACVEAFADAPEDGLFPEELTVIARAVPVRRAEFATGRACARTALRQLGFPEVAIERGAAGAPIWPAGVVGTITHCAGYRAAAVARTTDVLTLGADAEPHEPLPDGVLDLISSAAEREHMGRLIADRPDVHWDRLLFSAKESVYKAWYPLARRWLGHEEAAVEFSVDGTFAAELLVPGPVVSGREIGGFTGRWVVRDGLAVTGICVVSAPS